MDNFNLRAFLAKNPLNEAMSPQDVVDIADTVAEEFTKESAEAGEFLVYSVGKMEADDMSFELDTDLTSQSPKGIDTRGVGEGWGGIFRIKPTAEGYEVRNAEKGGLVAMIDNMGNFKMLSAAESRAELEGELDMDRYNDELDMKNMEEAEEAPKSNKMKKSELKEMIKAAFLGETDLEEVEVDAAAVQSDENEAMDQVDEAKDVDMIPAEKLFSLIARDLEFSPLAQDNVMLSKEDAIEIMRHVIAIEQSDISPEAALGEYIASGEFEEAGDIPGFEGTKDALNKLGLEEAEEEVDVEAEETEDVEAADVAVDDTETVDVEATAEISPEVKTTQDALTAAIEAAKALGDQKLADQIGNSITFFTRTHVVGQDKVAETIDIFSERMLKNAGIKK